MINKDDKIIKEIGYENLIMKIYIRQDQSKKLLEGVRDNVK